MTEKNKTPSSEINFVFHEVPLIQIYVTSFCSGFYLIFTPNQDSPISTKTVYLKRKTFVVAAGGGAMVSEDGSGVTFLKAAGEPVSRRDAVGIVMGKGAELLCPPPLYHTCAFKTPLCRRDLSSCRPPSVCKLVVARKLCRCHGDGGLSLAAFQVEAVSEELLKAAHKGKC